jgi:hypothetical protein
MCKLKKLQSEKLAIGCKSNSQRFQQITLNFFSSFFQSNLFEDYLTPNISPGSSVRQVSAQVKKNLNEREGERKNLKERQSLKEGKWAITTTYLQLLNP